MPCKFKHDYACHVCKVSFISSEIIMQHINNFDEWTVFEAYLFLNVFKKIYTLHIFTHMGVILNLKNESL